MFASTVGQTNAINVSAESPDPATAAAVANAYVTAYIEYRRKQVVDDTLAAGEQIQSKIADLQRQIDAAPEAEGSGPDLALLAHPRHAADPL